MVIDIMCQGLYDKGKGALLREETRFYDEQGGHLVAVAVSGSFLRGKYVCVGGLRLLT